MSFRHQQRDTTYRTRGLPLGVTSPLKHHVAVSELGNEALAAQASCVGDLDKSFPAKQVCEFLFRDR